MEVTGYIINPQFPGAPKPFRRYISAPKVQFEATVEKPTFIASSKIPSGNPDDYVFDDFLTERQPLPGKGVGLVDPDGPEFSINIGGTIRDNTDNAIKAIKNLPQNVRPPIKTVNLEDPFTGEPVSYTHLRAHETS